MHIRLWIPVVACGLLGAAGCATRSAIDARVERITQEAAVRDPDVGVHSVSDAAAVRARPPADAPPLELDRETVLKLAARHARTLQTSREQLYLSAQALAKTARGFGVLPSGAIEYAMGLAGTSEDEDTGKANLAASRKLATGADLTVSGTSALTRQPAAAGAAGGTDSTAYSSSIDLLLSQPLLAGAGYEASHDALIQAEQDLLYGLRDFALERQDFAIRVLNAYYDTLNQRVIVENTRQNAEQSAFLRRRSEALFKVRRANYLDVLRSRQQENSTSNQLIIARIDYATQVQKLLLTLGMPESAPAEVTGSVPDRIPVSLVESNCLALAAARRLDLRTLRDRCSDAGRRVRVARNAVLPNVSVFGRTGYRSEPADSFSAQDLEEGASAGLRLDLPLDMRDERDAVVSAEIDREKALRDFEEKESTVSIEVMEDFRRLWALYQSVDIQAANVTIADQRLRNAVMRFRNGELSNRDVVEAQEEMLSARNNHTRALTNYELQRVRLLRDTGLLDVAVDGLLIEYAPAVDGGRGPETARPPRDNP